MENIFKGLILPKLLDILIKKISPFLRTLAEPPFLIVNYSVNFFFLIIFEFQFLFIAIFLDINQRALT